MTDKLTPHEVQRKAQFLEITKGLSNHKIACALTKLRPAIDWRKSTKGSMVSAWLGQNVAFEMDDFSIEQLGIAVDAVLQSK